MKGAAWRIGLPGKPARAPMTIAFEAQRDRPDEGASLSDTVRSEPPEIAFAMKDACHEAA